MKRRKFVNIKIEGESNIGIIDLGEVDGREDDTTLVPKLRAISEEKLVEALADHFDCEIRTISVEVISTLGHIEIRAVVIIRAEEEDRQESVTMEETWVY